MEKEFKKLSADQFKEAMEYLAAIQKLCDLLDLELSNASEEKFSTLVKGDYSLYGHVYELPVHMHLMKVALLLNESATLLETAATPDPQAAILEKIQTTLEDINTSKYVESPALDKSAILALIYPLGRSLQSMAAWGQSISGLLRDARENNSVESLMKAIQIDKAVIGCPTALNLITRAQIRGDKGFFKKLKSALNGRSKKNMAALDPMRFAFLLLREMGVDDLSAKNLEKLMTETLRLYASSPGTRKNLSKHYHKSRKIKTI